MHPAASVIIFTTLSGAGFGLIGIISLGYLGSERPALLAGVVVALVLTVAGLLASTFHLRNPQRAWRALSQIRSSWLSREGLLAIVTLAVFAALALFRIETGAQLIWVGNAATLLAVLTVFATAMIYASLKTVPLWHTVWTPICYLLFAAAGGGLLASLIVAMTGGFDMDLTRSTLFLMVAAWLVKSAWWARASHMGFAAAGLSPETATGLGDLGKVRMLEAPHTSPNYLMKEMVYRVGRKHAQTLRLIAVIQGAAVPVCLLLVALAFGDGWILLMVAAISHFTGVLAERWLFFAEARHVVSLYYGYR